MSSSATTRRMCRVARPAATASSNIAGASGNDFISAKGGSDVVDGGAGDDTLDYSASPGGVFIFLPLELRLFFRQRRQDFMRALRAPTFNDYLTASWRRTRRARLGRCGSRSASKSGPRRRADHRHGRFGVGPADCEHSDGKYRYVEQRARGSGRLAFETSALLTTAAGGVQCFTALRLPSPRAGSRLALPCPRRGRRDGIPARRSRSRKAARLDRR